MATDNSLRVIARNGPLSEPLLDSREVTSLELRDTDGNLVALVIMVPGHPVWIVSKSEQDDFSSFAANMGFALKIKD
jgi:hypothetical protein